MFFMLVVAISLARWCKIGFKEARKGTNIVEFLPFQFTLENGTQLELGQWVQLDICLIILQTIIIMKFITFGEDYHGGTHWLLNGNFVWGY
jgi:hypothetical protein